MSVERANENQLLRGPRVTQSAHVCERLLTSVKINQVKSLVNMLYCPAWKFDNTAWKLRFFSIIEKSGFNPYAAWCVEISLWQVGAATKSCEIFKPEDFLSTPAVKCGCWRSTFRSDNLKSNTVQEKEMDKRSGDINSQILRTTEINHKYNTIIQSSCDNTNK